jgi:threonine synthase
VAQQLGWKTGNATVVLPIGNAGNVTAIMEGFIDLKRLDIIDELPQLLGVQSERANPVARWRASGNYQPMTVTPSVAQAAMIGNPVSFPKVQGLVEDYFEERFFCVTVSEQQIMDTMLTANRHGHVVCTQGGEAIAGARFALAEGIIDKGRKIVCDSTSHQLKFSGFQDDYFDGTLEEEYGVVSKAELVNKPVGLDADPEKIAEYLGLVPR